MKRVYLILIINLCIFNGWSSLVFAQHNQNADSVNSSLSNDTVVDTTQKAISVSQFVKSTNIQESNSSKTNYLYIGIISLIVSFFISLFMLLIVWYGFLRERILKIVKTNIEGNDKLRPGRLNTAISNLVSSMLPRETQNNAKSYNVDEILSQVIEKLKKDQSYQRMSNNQNQQIKEDVKPDVAPPMVVTQPTIPPQSKHFFSIEPRSGGNFFFVDKTTTGFEETESVYYFEKQGEYSAQFRVIDDIPTMKRAISYKAELLDIACDSLNGSQGAQKIINDKPGTVKKEGDKWVIVTKAKIKFV